MRFILQLFIGIAALSVATGPAHAEDADLPPVDYPSISSKVAVRSELVPAGWTLEAEASGDLDGDGHADLALVIQSEKPDLDNQGKPLVGPRMLIIAFASADASGGANGGAKGYRVVVADHQLIPRSADRYLQDCFDAGAESLSISKGKLVIALNHFATAGGWSMWSKTFTFAWKKGRMLLAGFKLNETDRSSGETMLMVADYRTGGLKVTRGNIETDATKTRRSKLPGPSVVALQDVGDGMEFNPVPEK